MKTLKHIALYVALLLGLITPALALAQTPAVNTTVSASANLTAADTKLKARGDAEIDRRIAALTNLSARVQAMQKVTPEFKTALNTVVQTQISGLTTLKAKINADTDSATLKTDLASVTSSYRVFALVLPQARIAAAADREVVLVSMMSTLGAKLQAHIQAAQQAGANVTDLTGTLNDMAAKLQEAQTQASAAIAASAVLTSDNGDKTVMASNTAALKKARTNIKDGMTALIAARKDADTIVKGIKVIEAALTASSTAATQ